MGDFRRGEIYYIEKSQGQNVAGSEQAPARPAIIVSNNKCNMFSSVVEVVYLTTQEKIELPTHVDINSTNRKSTALCEQVHSVFVDRIGNYVSMCTEQEMQMIDVALAISLGLDFGSPEQSLKSEEVKICFAPPEMQPENSVYDGLRDDLLKCRTECELYKQLYNQLLERVMK